jgi:hypothetical protein
MLRSGILLLLGIEFVTGVLAAPSSSSEAADAQRAKHEAQILASNGQFLLNLARIFDAQTNCDAALKLDPANDTAKDCLNRIGSMLVDQGPQ